MERFRLSVSGVIGQICVMVFLAVSLLLFPSVPEEPLKSTVKDLSI